MDRDQLRQTLFLGGTDLWAQSTGLASTGLAPASVEPAPRRDSIVRLKAALETEDFLDVCEELGTLALPIKAEVLGFAASESSLGESSLLILLPELQIAAAECRKNGLTSIHARLALALLFFNETTEVEALCETLANVEREVSPGELLTILRVFENRVERRMVELKPELHSILKASISRVRSLVEQR